MSWDASNDYKLERYLDGLMADQEAADFLKTIDPDELERVQTLQDQIDASLVNLFPTTPLDEEAITREFMASDSVQNSTAAVKSDAFGRRSLIRIALVASLLVLAALAVQFYINDDNRIEVAFAPTPLADVYQDCLNRGFAPVYDCEDPERFANTFKFNLGQSMALAQMPPGSRMLGLSTLGGISRDSIAMLCEVDGNKVIVFVARSNSRGLETATADDPSDLSLFVEKKNGLVFCEVTPLKSSRMIEHFQFVE